jgi:hypothetical protein
MRVGWAVHVAHMREVKNTYMILVRKPEKKIPLEIPTHKWDDNIKTDLK